MTDNTFPIMLVEDNIHEVVFMKRAWKLKNIQHPLVVASHGEDCLEYLRKTDNAAPGLILMDIRMPVMDGIQCLHEIKQDDTLAHIPVVMLTTSKNQEDRNRSFAEGCNTYIQKPQTFEDLTNTIEMISAYWQLNLLP